MATSLRSRAFTLVELLVVIVIIALLAGILMPALMSASEKAKQTATKTYMASIGSACESYNLSFGSYPGYFSDVDFQKTYPRLAQTFTGNENLVISLMGQVVTTAPTNKWPQNKIDRKDYFPGFGMTYKFFDLDRIGSGPKLESGEVLAPFYNPKEGQLGVIQHNGDTGTTLDYAFENDIPEFVDGAGVPLLYCRINPAGDLPVRDFDGTDPTPGQLARPELGLLYFSTTKMIPAGGGDPINQGDKSVLSKNGAGSIASLDKSDPGQPYYTNLAWIYGDTRLNDYDTGDSTSMNVMGNKIGAGYVISAAGSDNIYFSKDQLGVDVEKTMIDRVEDLEKFDDIVLRGGSQ